MSSNTSNTSNASEMKFGLREILKRKQDSSATHKKRFGNMNKALPPENLAFLVDHLKRKLLRIKNVKVSMLFGMWGIEIDGVFTHYYLDGSIFYKVPDHKVPFFQDNGCPSISDAQDNLNIRSPFYTLPKFYVMEDIVDLVQSVIDDERNKLSQDNPECPVNHLVNINVKLAKSLVLVGINNLGELKDIGAVKAYMLICSFNKSNGVSTQYSFNNAMRLQGAIDGCLYQFVDKSKLIKGFAEAVAIQRTKQFEEMSFFD